jgi:hypothetical protein
MKVEPLTPVFAARGVGIVDDVPSLGELTWEEAVPQPYAKA